MGVGRSRREKSVQRAENGPIKATRLLRQPHQGGENSPRRASWEHREKGRKGGWRVGGTQESKVKVLPGHTRRGGSSHPDLGAGLCLLLRVSLPHSLPVSGHFLPPGGSFEGYQTSQGPLPRATVPPHTFEL